MLPSRIAEAARTIAKRPTAAFIKNRAGFYGGGAYRGTYMNCTFTGNGNPLCIFVLWRRGRQREFNQLHLYMGISILDRARPIIPRDLQPRLLRHRSPASRARVTRILIRSFLPMACISRRLRLVVEPAPTSSAAQTLTASRGRTRLPWAATNGSPRRPGRRTAPNSARRYSSVGNLWRPRRLRAAPILLLVEQGWHFP